MTEDVFEDELPWLGPLPQVPSHREQPQSAVIRRAPAPAAYPPVPIPAPRGRPAVPPYAQISQHRHGETRWLQWSGLFLIFSAIVAAAALVVHDPRSGAGSPEPPAAQVVIPPAANTGSSNPAVVPLASAAYAGKIICLDAAHGGFDRGFRRVGDAAAPAMDEALYTAAYARDLAGQLNSMGFTVAMTRTGDDVRNIEYKDTNGDGKTRQNANNDADAQRNALLDELQSRIDFCNEERADLLISLHFDGWNDPNSSGFSIWHSENRADSAQSQRAAMLIDQQLASSLGAAGYSLTDGGVLPESIATAQGNQMLYDSLFLITGARDGLKTPSRMPGVVVDPLAISNVGDAQLLANGAARDTIVAGLAQAIGIYFDERAAAG